MMSDPMDRQINIEEQRARMQTLLRHCESGLLITTQEGTVRTAFVNASDLELLGLVKVLNKHVDQLTGMDEDAEPED